MRPLRELLERHPLPDLTGGKDDSGTVLIIGGPPSCPGAVLLAGLAALRIGAGRVQLVVHPSVAAAAAVARPEALVMGWDQTGKVPDAIATLVVDADCLVIGPGHDRLRTGTVRSLVARAGCPVVLDAGALAAVPELPNADLVIAPNPSEAGRLVGAAGDGADADEDPEGLARTLMERFVRPVAVRGATTVVADGAECWSFDDAPPGLGTPGSGDVFVGVLAGLLAAGLPADGALAWAVQLHAAAGALLAEATPVGYLAGDVADHLPRALADALRCATPR